MYFILIMSFLSIFFFFFFNDTATTEIYTLSLHDALPIARHGDFGYPCVVKPAREGSSDRKSTRLNSSHVAISYAVFCLKKKKKNSEASHREKQKKPITRHVMCNIMS